MNLETPNLQITSFFPGFELKFQLFPLLSKFKAFSGPGKVNDKTPGFPGRVTTLNDIVAQQYQLPLIHFHFDVTLLTSYRPPSPKYNP